MILTNKKIISAKPSQKILIKFQASYLVSASGPKIFQGMSSCPPAMPYIPPVQITASDCPDTPSDCPDPEISFDPPSSNMSVLNIELHIPATIFLRSVRHLPHLFRKRFIKNLKRFPASTCRLTDGLRKFSSCITQFLHGASKGLSHLPHLLNALPTGSPDSQSRSPHPIITQMTPIILIKDNPCLHSKWPPHDRSFFSGQESHTVQIPFSHHFF